jgi:hypothetical protein
MRVTHLISRYPITVFGLCVLAFIIWLWRDAIPANQPQPDLEAPKIAQMDPDELPRKRLPPRLLPLPEPVPEKAKPAPQGTAQSLSKLKPGMTRAEVEGLVGIPSAQDTYPATVMDGKVIYHTTYEADLEPPATVRPIRIPRPHPMGRDPQPKERTLVTLEFDATKPGHPLLSIYYPDPLL